MGGYSTREVSDLIGMKPDQVRHYVRRSLIDPERTESGEYRFNFQDVVLLRTAKSLLDANVSARKAYRILLKLQSELTHVDYKDHYMLQAAEGWTSITLPTKEQEEYYQVDMSQIKGMIVMCLNKAFRNKFLPDELISDDVVNIGKPGYDGDELERFEVNGLPAKTLISVGDCFALKGENNGLYWPKKTIDGDERYEIRAKVNPPKDYLRISSISIL